MFSIFVGTKKMMKMRKILSTIGWLIVVMVMVAVDASAQTTLGVRTGGSYSSMAQKVEGTYRSGARCGFSVAGLADIHVYKRWSFRPEVAFVNEGGSFLSNYAVEGARNSYNKCNYYSIQIPLDAAYTFAINDIHLGVYFGPSFDFSLFGKMNTENQNVDINFGDTKDTDLKSFDLGVNVGVHVDYKQYFFAISSVFGTFDRRAVKGEGESSLYQNNVTLSLGYMFR